MDEQSVLRYCRQYIYMLNVDGVLTFVTSKLVQVLYFFKADMNSKKYLVAILR